MQAISPRRRLPVVLGLAAAGLAVVGTWVWLVPRVPPEPSQSEHVWFADVTAQVGLDFVHVAGPTGDYFMPQIMGSGAALLDVDNDGLLDIYLLQNDGPVGAPNQLFRQLPDGCFTNATAGSGLGVAGHNMGVAVGDVNNDGWSDLLVTRYGGLTLFLNRGDGTFRDATDGSGLDCPSWGTSACFFDFDRDGWLDLVVTCYVNYDRSRPCGPASGRRDYCHPSVFPGATTRLFRNLGGAAAKAAAKAQSKGAAQLQSAVFQDVTALAGLAKTPGPGLGVVCFDADGDGWPDIFVANDSQANRLWINQRNGTFREEATVRGAAFNAMGQAQANMGIASADVDGDGLLDLFVTHLTEESHTLWKQGPRGLFQDRTHAAGLATPHWRGTGFGTVLGDFDHDGWPDLAIVNGRVSEHSGASAQASAQASTQAGSFWDAYAERNQLFANDGAGQFRDVSLANPPFCAKASVARGLAMGVLNPKDNGALSLLVTTVAGPARLYKNAVRQRGSWLLVRALVSCPDDPKVRRDAHGALITVRAGQRQWVRHISPAQSYLSSCDPRGHFGLGAITQVDAIEVEWPDGTAEAFAGCPTDRVVTLCQGEGRRRDFANPTKP